MNVHRLWMHIAAVALCSPLSAEIGNIVVTSASNFAIGVPERGSLATVFCTGLDLPPSIVSAREFPLPYTLSSVRVFINGTASPLLAVADLGGFQQINLQVPTSSELPLEVDVVVEQDSLRAVARSPLLASSPGEFFRASTGLAALQHAADYSPVTTEHPARPGETVIAYLTGMPMTVPSVPPGAAAPLEPLAVVPQYSFAAGIESFRVFVDGKMAEPLFVGLAPGLAGVYQINFTVPAGVEAGTRQLMLERFSCRAAFGSCANGGGTSRTYRSQSAMIRIQ